MRTAKEWFDYLEDGLRDKCVKYAQDEMSLYGYYDSLADAISMCFVWEYTLEGKLFWSDVYEKVRMFNSELFKKTPTVVEVQMNANHKQSNQ